MERLGNMDNPLTSNCHEFLRCVWKTRCFQNTRTTIWVFSRLGKVEHCCYTGSTQALQNIALYEKHITGALHRNNTVIYPRRMQVRYSWLF